MSEEEELTDRQKKILDVIIQNYLETGEPVGSRTISKSSDLNLSSATIRNEMSDLEEMGYILQPHTSAGRIPSDKGYRFYVTELMNQKEASPPPDSTSEMLVQRTDRLEKMLKQVVDVLAANTQYTSMISAPAITGVRVKFVQLSAVNERQLLSVVVMDGNAVRNRIIDIDAPLNNEDLLKLNMLLNTNLSGKTVNDINLGLIQKMKASAGEYADIIENVLENVAGTIEQDEGRTIYTSGTTNIFKYPELSDANRASHLISTFENKEQLEKLINEIETDDEGNSGTVGSDKKSQLKEKIKKIAEKAKTEKDFTKLADKDDSEVEFNKEGKIIENTGWSYLSEDNLKKVKKMKRQVWLI